MPMRKSRHTPKREDSRLRGRRQSMRTAASASPRAGCRTAASRARRSIRKRIVHPIAHKLLRLARRRSLREERLQICQHRGRLGQSRNGRRPTFRSCRAAPAGESVRTRARTVKKSGGTAESGLTLCPRRSRMLEMPYLSDADVGQFGERAIDQRKGKRTGSWSAVRD